MSFADVDYADIDEDARLLNELMQAAARGPGETANEAFAALNDRLAHYRSRTISDIPAPPPVCTGSYQQTMGYVTLSPQRCPICERDVEVFVHALGNSFALHAYRPGDQTRRDVRMSDKMTYLFALLLAVGTFGGFWIGMIAPRSAGQEIDVLDDKGAVVARFPVAKDGDATDAMQRAVSCAGAKSERVYFPPGTYGTRSAK